MSILYPRVLGGDQQQASRDPWQARATAALGLLGEKFPFPKYSRGRQPVPERGRGRGLSRLQAASSARQASSFCLSEQVESLRPTFSELGPPPDLG